MEIASTGYATTGGADTGTTVSSRLTGAVMQKGEPMNSKEAIKMLRTIQETVYLGSLKFYEAIDVAIKALKQPTIESQRWIPCSERLPEVGTYVLVSKKPLSFRSNLPNVCMAHRSCDPRSGKEEWIDMLFGKLDDDDVLAWMPLPTPYREEGGKQ